MEHFYQGIFGWFDYEEVYSEMVKTFPSNSHFVEVGSFKGKSSAYMAVEIINSGKHIQFDCIDTWLGSDEHQAGEAFADQDVVEGTLYDRFLENMKQVQEFYTPVRSNSIEAAAKYEDQSLDFVFIDANHTYEGVKEDIIAWRPKVRPGGVLAGHDIPWEGVRKAVDEMISKYDVVGTSWKITV